MPIGPATGFQSRQSRSAGSTTDLFLALGGKFFSKPVK